MTKNERIAFVVSIMVTPLVYMACAGYAYAQRGYMAFGGECCAFLIPAITSFVIRLQRL